jgi:hypothetical protein
MSAAEHVKVEMIDGLAAILAGVDHDPIAFVGQALLAGDSRSEQQQISETVRLSGILDRCNVPAWNDEQMRGSLRVYVSKHESIV